MKTPIFQYGFEAPETSFIDVEPPVLWNPPPAQYPVSMALWFIIEMEFAWNIECQIL